MTARTRLGYLAAFALAVGCASQPSAQGPEPSPSPEDQRSDGHGAHPGDREHGHADRGDERSVEGEAHEHAGDESHEYKQHEGMPHRFADAERWAKRFENPERDAWQKPKRVLAAMQLEPDMTVANIGSATGYFSVRLARAVPEGKVIGIDIEPDMVRYLNERAASEGLSNLQSVLAEPDDPELPADVDRVLVVNTYHHIGQRSAYFEKVRGSLAAGGLLTIVDFKQGELPVGPPEKHRIPLEKVDEELKVAGMERISLVDLPHQFVATYGVAE